MSLVKVRLHPGQVTCPSQGHRETNNHPNSPTNALVASEPECMYLKCERKPEKLELARTRTDGQANLSKLRIYRRSEATTFLLWRDSAKAELR